jgi:hypothetical protein
MRCLAGSVKGDFMLAKFFPFIFFLLFIGCSVNSGSANNASISNDGHFQAYVFDCAIEIPDEYSLHTNERSSFMFSKINNGVGSISISDLDKEAFTSKTMKIVDTQKFEELNVLFLKVNPGLNNKEPSDVVVIHNNKQAITIIGDDLNLWKEFVRSCKEYRESN